MYLARWRILRRNAMGQYRREQGPSAVLGNVGVAVQAELLERVDAEQNGPDVRVDLIGRMPALQRRQDIVLIDRRQQDKVADGLLRVQVTRRHRHPSGRFALTVPDFTHCSLSYGTSQRSPSLSRLLPRPLPQHLPQQLPRSSRTRTSSRRATADFRQASSKSGVGHQFRRRRPSRWGPGGGQQLEVVSQFFGLSRFERQCRSFGAEYVTWGTPT